MKSQSEIKRSSQVHLHGNTNDIRLWMPGFNFLSIDRAKNDGRAWEDLGAIFEGKIQPSGQYSNNHIDFPSGIFSAQEIRQFVLIDCVRKPRRVEVLVVNLEL